MLIKTLPVGHLETNCYVVTDENTLECAVIDPGAESNTILGYLEDNRLRCRAVMLTHAHFDHTGALAAVLEETGAELYFNEKEAGGATVPGFKPFDPPEGARHYSEGDEVRVGSLVFRVLETPDVWYGMTYREDRDAAAAALRELHGRGVYPARLWS